MHKTFRGEVVYNAENDVHFPNLVSSSHFIHLASDNLQRPRPSAKPSALLRARVPPAPVSPVSPVLDGPNT